MANQNQPTKIFRWIRIPTVSRPSFFISTSLYFPDIPLHIILPYIYGFRPNDIYIGAIIRHKNVIAKIVDEGLIGKQYQCNIIVSKNGSIEIHATDNHIGGTSLRLNIHRMRRERWGIFPEHIPPKLVIEIQKCNFTGTRTFEIYVPIEYSLSTTITIGLSDVEQGTIIKAWIYYSGQQIKYIEEKPQAQGAWTKAFNISREYVKGTWKLKISTPEYVLLDKYQISITTRTDPTKYDTDGDGMGDGKEVKGIDVDGVKIWTNPLLKDTDMDGLSDSKELSIGTNPLSKDTDADGIIDSQDKTPTGNRLLEIKIGEIEVELHKKYVWRYLTITWTGIQIVESWGSDKWMEDTLFCVIIDTKYNAFILPYLYGKGRANYQNNPETKAYYVDIPDNVESTTIRKALYIKSGYTTFWIWWHKALEKRVGLSSNWDTLDEKRDVRHINLGFYEEWLRTEAQLEYMAKTYPQTFTKIYMVTKPDFVVKPDTEYVVIIMRVDGEFRTIACPREIFLETKLGDAIMSEDNTTLTNMGLEDADISGFSESKISPYVYGLITKSDATSTIWNKVVAAITQNTSGVKIANIVQMSKILLPKDIVKMIPLNVLPQQGKSLPEYMSPEASIWAAMVGFVTEIGRLLCELFVALANFLAKFLETIAEWGLKLLGVLWQVLGVAKYLFAMALCIWSWMEALVYFGVILLLSATFLGLQEYINTPFNIHVDSTSVCLDVAFSDDIYVNICVGLGSMDFYDFPIACLLLSMHFSLITEDWIIDFSLDVSEPLVPFVHGYEDIQYVFESRGTKKFSSKTMSGECSQIQTDYQRFVLDVSEMVSQSLIYYSGFCGGWYLGKLLATLGSLCLISMVRKNMHIGQKVLLLGGSIALEFIPVLVMLKYIAPELANHMADSGVIPRSGVALATAFLRFLGFTLTLGVQFDVVLMLLFTKTKFDTFKRYMSKFARKFLRLPKAVSEGITPGLILGIIFPLILMIIKDGESESIEVGANFIIEKIPKAISFLIRLGTNYLLLNRIYRLVGKINKFWKTGGRTWARLMYTIMLLASAVCGFIYGNKVIEGSKLTPQIVYLDKPVADTVLEVTTKTLNDKTQYVIENVEFNFSIEDLGGINIAGIEDVAIALGYRGSLGDVFSVSGWRIRIDNWIAIGLFTPSIDVSIEFKEGRVNVSGKFSIVLPMSDPEWLSDKSFGIFILVRDSDGNEVAFVIPVLLKCGDVYSQ